MRATIRPIMLQEMAFAIYLSPVCHGGFQPSDIRRHGDEGFPKFGEDIGIKMVVRVVRIVQQPLDVCVVALPRRMVCSG